MECGNATCKLPLRHQHGRFSSNCHTIHYTLQSGKTKRQIVLFTTRRLAGRHDVSSRKEPLALFQGLRERPVLAVERVAAPADLPKRVLQPLPRFDEVEELALCGFVWVSVAVRPQMGRARTFAAFHPSQTTRGLTHTKPIGPKSRARNSKFCRPYGHGSPSG